MNQAYCLVGSPNQFFYLYSIRQWFANLSLHWNLLGSFKDHWCLCPTPRDRDLNYLAVTCVLEFLKGFQSFNMQTSLGPFLLGDSRKIGVRVFWHMLWGHNHLILRLMGNQRKESCVAGRLYNREAGMKAKWVRGGLVSHTLPQGDVSAP